MLADSDHCTAGSSRAGPRRLCRARPVPRGLRAARFHSRGGAAHRTGVRLFAHPTGACHGASGRSHPRSPHSRVQLFASDPSPSASHWVRQCEDSPQDSDSAQPRPTETPAFAHCPPDPLLRAGLCQFSAKFHEVETSIDSKYPGAIVWHGCARKCSLRRWAGGSEPRARRLRTSRARPLAVQSGVFRVLCRRPDQLG